MYLPVHGSIWHANTAALAGRLAPAGRVWPEKGSLEHCQVFGGVVGFGGGGVDVAGGLLGGVVTGALLAGATPAGAGGEVAGLFGSGFAS